MADHVATINLEGEQIIAIFYADVLPLFWDRQGQAPVPRVDLEWIEVEEGHPAAVPGVVEIGDMLEVESGDRGRFGLVEVIDIADILRPMESPPTAGKWIERVGADVMLKWYARGGVETGEILPADQHKYLNFPGGGVAFRIQRLVADGGVA